MQFKVGQTVELVDNAGMAAPLGATAIIERVGGIYIYVVWGKGADGQGNGGYWPHQFKSAFKKNQQLLFSFMYDG